MSTIATTDPIKTAEEVPAPVSAEVQKDTGPTPAAPETKPASEAPKEAPATSPGPRYDARVKEIAEGLGWSREDIESYPSPAHLARALNAYHKQLIGRVPPPPTEAAPAAKTEAAPTAAPTVPEGWRPKLNRDDNPDLIDDLTALHNDLYGYTTKQAGALGARLSDFEQKLNAVSGMLAQSTQREFDQQFQRLPNEIAKIYGRGPTKRMAPDSEYGKARKELAQMMGTIAQAHALSGLDVLPIPDLFDAAVSMRHANELFTQQIKDVAATLEPANDEISMKPSASSPAMSEADHAKAIAFVEQFEREHGGA